MTRARTHTAHRERNRDGVVRPGRALMPAVRPMSAAGAGPGHLPLLGLAIATAARAREDLAASAGDG